MGAQGRDGHSAWLGFQIEIIVYSLEGTFENKMKTFGPQHIKQVKGETDAWKRFSENDVGS